jgi:hypothetical protein
MAEQHPVQALRAGLETARLQVIEKLDASPDPLTGGDLQLLAMIQTGVKCSARGDSDSRGRMGRTGIAAQRPREATAPQYKPQWRRAFRKDRDVSTA